MSTDIVVCCCSCCCINSTSILSSRYSAYEMKNNCWLFERHFKIQENDAFLFEISFFVLKILAFLYYEIRKVMT